MLCTRFSSRRASHSCTGSHRSCGHRKHVRLADEGPSVLTERQRYVPRQALDAQVARACKRCGAPIPRPKMHEARNSGGSCSWNWHMTEKSRND